MPLSEAIQTIQQARYELAESNRKARLNERYKAGDFVKDADASECLWLINELIDRVSSIVGEAGDLEDADCVLIKHIENEDTEPYTCAQCNGSGKGQYDGSRCLICKGKGTVEREE